MGRDISSLASLIGTSSKTIRRDISELKSQGIVISEVSEANNRKVYSIDKSALPPLKLTFDEALAIFFGTKSLSGFEGTGFEEAARSAIGKLRAFLGEPESLYLDKVLPRIHSSKRHEALCNNRSVVDELMVALEDERAIFIEYQLSKLPTAFHKAGLAGLLLLINSLHARGKPVVPNEVFCIDGEKVTIEFSESLLWHENMDESMYLLVNKSPSHYPTFLLPSPFGRGAGGEG